MLYLRKRKLALIIPAHNEEVVIGATISSAIKAGQNKRDIFVVSDGSTDETVNIALNLLGESNVLDASRSGKSGAIKKAINHFEFELGYRWLHTSDADSIFGKQYFKIIRRHLNPKMFVAATGYVQSLPGDWISKFRVYEYVWGFSVIRRIQALLGVLIIMPGPTTCLRTDILNKLNFESGSLTEDFDLTLQIHRNSIGKIQYIPHAKTYTQDPKDFDDYRVQISRWYRGFFQGVKAHKVGFRPQKIDLYITLILAQTFLYTGQIFLFLPILALLTHQINFISAFFLTEIFIYFVIALFSAVASKRLDIMAAFPLFYVLRLVNLIYFTKAFIEIIILNRFSETSQGWSTAGRRYKISAENVN